jgi:hypothetical protein
MPATVRTVTPADEPFFNEAQLQISRYLTAFLSISSYGSAFRVSVIGSGTFVTIGGRRGIMTAAHVLDAVPTDGLTYLARVNTRHVQHIAVEATSANRLNIGGPDFTDEGPDLGFMLLSPEVASSLAASCNFYDLSPKGIPTSFPPGTEGFDAVAGLVEELTTERIDPTGSFQVTHLSPRLEIGLEVSAIEASGFDYISIRPEYSNASAAPTTYGGMSGGALWRATAKLGDDGFQHLDKKWIRGVAYFETAPERGLRTLRCHGTDSIYKKLWKKIQSEFP